jgi:hypothetical protein
MFGHFLKICERGAPYVTTFVLAIFSTDLRAQAFLFSGASSTFESGLSQTNTRGAVAVANNPANTIITKRIELYGDFSLVNFDYQYSRPGYAPVGIKATAPPINFGVSFKPNSKIAMGVFMTPRPAVAPQVVKNVPQDLSGEVTVVDIEAKQGSFITAFGLGFKVNNNLAIGFSGIETAEDSQLIVRDAGTTDDKNALLGMRLQGSFVQFLIGFRSMPSRQLTLAGSYKTAVAKKYSGTLIIKGDQDDRVNRKGYAPGVISLGAEYRLGVPVVFGEMRREMWSAGASSFSSGLPGAPSKTALQDTFILVAGGRFKLRETQVASASLGMYGANVGNGTPTSKTATSNAVAGPQFGDFDSMNRTMFSVSYRYIAKKLDIMGGLNFISGSRNVPENYPGAGRYSLTVLTLGAGVSKYF